MIRFLRSTIERQKPLSQQLSRLDMYAASIADGNAPFPCVTYEISTDGFIPLLFECRKPCIKPFFYFLKEAVRRCFSKREQTTTFTKNDLDEVRVSATGIITYKGKLFWSMTSAVFRGRNLRVKPFRNTDGISVLALFLGDTYLGHAVEISNP